MARVFTIGFAVIGLAFGMFQLLLLAPFLWMMTSAEQRAAHATHHAYGDVVEVYDDQPATRGWGSPFDPRAQPPDPFTRPALRRFTIVNRGGRLVIEEID